MEETVLDSERSIITVITAMLCFRSRPASHQVGQSQEESGFQEGREAGGWEKCCWDSRSSIPMRAGLPPEPLLLRMPRALLPLQLAELRSREQVI